MPKLGVFDSGIGGLTVVQELFQAGYSSIVYYADTARFPYGNKTESRIVDYAQEGLQFLLSKGATHLLIGCNTVSSISQHLEFSTPLYTLITPAAIQACAQSKNSIIGVIGTSQTVQSHSFSQSISANKSTASVLEKSCPLLASFIEEERPNTILKSIIHEYLLPLKGVDTLILGCTHYPLCRNLIQKEMKGVYLIDPAKALVASLDIPISIGSCEFFVSANPKEFQRKAKNLFDMSILVQEKTA